MDSSAIARYIPQKSKKRVFPGTSSSCMEPEVIDISSPPRNRSSKSKAKAPKHNEFVYCEVIDVDMDEDRNDVLFVDRKFESNQKGKGPMAAPLGPSSTAQLDSVNNIPSTKKVELNNKGKDVAIMPLGPNSASHLDLIDWSFPKKSFAPGLDNFFNLDDEIVFQDDYSILQSHFDNIDLPSGIEAQIPWLPEAFQAQTRVSASHLGPPAGRLPRVEPPPFWSSSPPAKNTKSSAIWQGPAYSTPQKPTEHMSVPSVETPLKVQHHHMLGSMKVAGTGPTSSFSQFPLNSTYSIGPDATKRHNSEAQTKNYIEHNDYYSTFVGTPEPAHFYPTGGVLVDHDAGKSGNRSSVVGSSSSMAGLENKAVLEKYENFKKFDTVLDFSDHYYSTQSAASKQPPKNWAKKIQEEWRILEKDLPDTIFVRVYESRMDLLRAVIIGAEGTPYHDGLFFFDVCFPSNYPNVPPLVHYHSGGLRINPNLYNCGKVCLSLLNTWTGGQKERWVPGGSTMLQVLVSIQGLILNTKPYFNEPGFAHSTGSVHGEQCSLLYNENTLILSLKTMVYTMKKPPKNFEDLVVGHFRSRVRDILMACKAYTEGVQVGCLVRGGVQDVDEGDKSCSAKFKHDVASYIKTLVGMFKSIGAKEAEEFIFLSQKISPLPPPPPPPPPVVPHPFAAYNVNYWS